MEGEEINLCVSVYGYSAVSMYLLYRKGNDLLELLLIITAGIVEPNSRLIYPIFEYLWLGREG